MGDYWVVFDYGEVISQRTNALPALAECYGVPVAEFTAAYWAERAGYDAGCTDLAYWGAIGDRLGVPVDQRLADRVAALDADGWLRPEAQTVALLDQLGESGAALALLSNAPASFARRVRALPAQAWPRHFRQLLFSGELGMVKPGERIWRELFARLDAAPGNCVFLDDRQENVDAARTAGMRARRWTDASDAHRWLASLGVLPASGSASANRH
ncbi:putative hydrolase of the HAD superfamily [Tamaricihabitans halophyticus]|uniref:Putative hydrolase of the HAD superfamily n=1 Tax=Tamaricihabitans halophyticus TaxID=1262583 RepID=A0A4R2R3R1_9PSEU|nr:HAD-IA family hydrolase [Tamaricihabitans halophyticus]TCP54171.1 putative hydrolase of the HAD superfamily [Tamaricihabitans halophyticus]